MQAPPVLIPLFTQLDLKLGTTQGGAKTTRRQQICLPSLLVFWVSDALMS